MVSLRGIETRVREASGAGGVNATRAAAGKSGTLGEKAPKAAEQMKQTDEITGPGSSPAGIP